MGNNLSNSQKVPDNVKKSTTDAIKTASKRAIQTAGDLFGNKIAGKITNASKKKSPTRSKNDDANSELEGPKKINISPEERWQIIDEIRLV